MIPEDNYRPMGNTPVTDAAAASASDGASEIASNADLRIGEKHGSKNPGESAQYGQEPGQRQPGIEDAGHDDDDETDDDAEAYEGGVAEAQHGERFDPAE